VDIQANYPGNGPATDGKGHLLFDPGAYKERCGLLLLNGLIYTKELAGALPGGEFATATYFNGAVYYGPVGSALTWRLPGP
jgi:hypothetical protein